MTARPARPSASLPAEFALIARHFAPLAGEGALGLTDDAALVDPPAGRTLVLAADAMVEGVHFLPEDPPDSVGRKLLRTNLSDLAAMGAEPFGYLLTTALPRSLPEAWIASFAAGLAADQAAFGLRLFGGDTVSTSGPISLSLTILGFVPPGQALLRAGARPGDALWVSGTIGDGVLGLRVGQGRLSPDAAGHLLRRYRLPEPRLALGVALRGIARAAMDVSDGLLQDCLHLCRLAGCAAEIEAAAVPLSAPARALLAEDPGLIATLVAGGDDYELLFAAPAEAEAEVRTAAARAGTPVTRIGTFRAGAPAVILRDAAGADITPAALGWSHL
jgi:thiamine-monophosphate kinase